MIPRKTSVSSWAPHTSVVGWRLLVVATILIYELAEARSQPMTKQEVTKLLWDLRAGSNSSPVELNPQYTNFASAQREHEEWLKQQQRQQQEPYYVPRHQQQQQPTQTRVFQGNDDDSLLLKTQNYFTTLYQLSPSLFWVMVGCVVNFVSWRKIPTRFMQQWFVNSHDNIRKTVGASLVLSSLSHIAPYHLLVNLVLFAQMAPSVTQIIRRSKPFSSKYLAPIWPFLLCSAVFSNLVYLAFSPTGARSLGLSGVTMSLLAVHLKTFPNHTFNFVVGLLPMSLKAKHLLQILMGGSLAGWLISNNTASRGGSDIAHLAHLGGLVFGWMFSEWILQGLSPHQILRKLFGQSK